MIEQNEDKLMLMASIDRGFKFESQILAAAYDLQKYKEKHKEDKSVSDLEQSLMFAITHSQIDDVVENQIEYYLSLYNLKETLGFEEKEKLIELREGILALLEMGVFCNPGVFKEFEEKGGSVT